MKKVVLVEVSAGLPVKGGYLGYSVFDPLGLEYLASSLIQGGHSAIIIKQFFGEQAEDLISRIVLHKPDVIAFGPLTYSYGYALDIARRIKKVHSDIYIVFGGVHVSSVPQMIDYGVVDCVVYGEGEVTLRQLVDCLDNPAEARRLAGVAYWKKGFHKTNPRPRVENLDSLPFPHRQTDIIQRTRLDTIMYPAISRQNSVCSVQYSRGCPYGCPYCASQNIWGRIIRWRSARNLVDEIEQLQSEYGTNTLFFTDLTFNAARSKVEEFCQEMQSRVQGVYWQAMLRMAAPDGELLVDPSLFKLMYLSGCRKINYGLESITQPIQDAFNKAITPEAMRQVLEWTSDAGIIVKAYLMLGEPFLESRASIEEAMRILPTLAIDELRLGFLTPFPGTVLSQRYADRLVSDDWSRYTSEEPLLHPVNVNISELTLWRKEVFYSFYNSKLYRQRVIDRITTWPELELPFIDFFANILKPRGITITL